MYKMLVLDMDGTLLNEAQEISDVNRIAIKAAVKKGIKVVLASGRAYPGLKAYLKELDLDHEGTYTISCSGALVMENVTENIIYEEHIKSEDLARIHMVCEKLDLDMSGYTINDMVVHHDNLFTKYDAIANKMDIKVVDFENLDENEKIYKLNIINESVDVRQSMIDYFPTIKPDSLDIREKPNFNKHALSELWRFPEDIVNGYTLVRPLPFCIELLDKHSNKAVGVSIVAEKYGISIDEIICMGDSGNDVHMLEEAGLGVAMANARTEAKNAADEVTVSNEENGVAVIINKYFLNED